MSKQFDKALEAVRKIAQHPENEWVLAGFGAIYKRYGGEFYAIATSNDKYGETIAWVDARRGREAANLIAAAPKLLHALERIKEGCGSESWEGQIACEAINTATKGE